MIEIFHFLKFEKFINELGKQNSIGEREETQWEFRPYHRMFGQMVSKSRDSRVDVVFVFILSIFFVIT